MKKLSNILSQLQTVPLTQVVNKVVRGLQKKTKAGLEALSDKQQCTYDHRFVCKDTIPSILSLPPADMVFEHALTIRALADYYCQAMFTVLDSGWVDYCIKGNNHRERLKRSVTSSNLHEASLALDSLLSSPFYSHQNNNCIQYYPIDWQLDCKSNFRWDSNQHYSEITYGDLPGVDVKVPWEIGRFQHAPILALAAMLSEGNEDAAHSKEFYAHTFRTQVLDFIAFNPPRFGVQWKTAMDCGLRATNMLIAFDMFRELGIEWDASFTKIFRRSLKEHVHFIYHHLEWSSTNRGNHYLANLSGMLFALKGLPKTDEHFALMRFAMAECSAEAELQFNRDGLNFEASLPYHCLSSELLAGCYAVLSSLNEKEKDALCSADIHYASKSAKIQPATPSEFNNALKSMRKALEKSADAMAAIAIDGIHMPNIGDNDSGSMLRFTPNGHWLASEKAASMFMNLNPSYELPETVYVYSQSKTQEPFEWICDTLDMRASLALISGAIGRDCPQQSLKTGSIEYQIMSSIAKHNNAKSGMNAIPMNFDEVYPKTKEFNDFGLWIYESEEYKAVMRAGSIGQQGKGGHAHNDQLTMCLAVGKEEFFGDPGTFFYTASPIMRNIGRSVAMHSTLFLPGKEQNKWVDGAGDVLFWMNGDQARADGMFVQNVWKGGHHAFGKPHLRSISFGPRIIHGHDSCQVPSKKIIQFHCVPGIIALAQHGVSIPLKSPLGTEITLVSLAGFSWEVLPAVYSRAYGRVEESIILRMEIDEKTTDIHWEIRISDG